MRVEHEDLRVNCFYSFIETAISSNKQSEYFIHVKEIKDSNAISNKYLIADEYNVFGEFISEHIVSIESFTFFELDSKIITLIKAYKTKQLIGI